jgi:hypothetical protein
MPPQHTKPGLASAAFFGPRSQVVEEDYLASLHSFLRQNKHGQMFLREVAALDPDQVWSVFAAANAHVAALSEGPGLVAMIRDWAADGASGPFASCPSSIVWLSLLLVVQVAQYLQYLDHYALSHQEFMAGVAEGGGLHGYCGGLPVC